MMRIIVDEKEMTVEEFRLLLDIYEAIAAAEEKKQVRLERMREGWYEHSANTFEN